MQLIDFSFKKDAALLGIVRKEDLAYINVLLFKNKENHRSTFYFAENYGDYQDYRIYLLFWSTYILQLTCFHNKFIFQVLLQRGKL